MAGELVSKLDALKELLGKGPALLHVDTRAEGVDVPEGLRESSMLRLKVSWAYAHPLSLDDDAIRQRLTFPEGSYACTVPWDAIFAVGEDGSIPSRIWPKNLPEEVKRLVVLEKADGTVVPVAVPAVAEAGDLLADADVEPAAEAEAEAAPAPQIRRGHLTLIKG